MRDVAIREVFGSRKRMERIACGVHPGKPHSTLDRVQPYLLAFDRHGSLAICSQSRQVAGCEKHDGGEGTKFFLIENASVLGHFHFESMLVPQLGDHVIHDAWLPVDSFHYGMFESRRFREYQHRFIPRPPQPVRKREACSRQRCGSEKVSSRPANPSCTPFVMFFPSFPTRQTFKHTVL